MKIGVELFYLPPRSPELNDIERVWRSAKYKGYPHRAHIQLSVGGPVRPGTHQCAAVVGARDRPLAQGLANASACLSVTVRSREAGRESVVKSSFRRRPGWLGECLRSRPPSEASGSGGRAGGLGVQGTAEPIVGGAEGGFRWAAQFGEELPVVVYAGIRREFTAEPAAEGGGVARSA